MNLDFDNPNGSPEKEFLTGIPRIRFEFKIRRDLGENLQNKIAFYKNKLNYYQKPATIVFTHRSGFEKEGRKRWEDFNTYDWRDLKNDFINYLTPVWKELASPENAFQIWNEPEGAPTGRSVLIPPEVYGELFKASYQQIKLQSNTKVITAGFKSGSAASYEYFKKTGITRCDGLALHLYVCGAKVNPDFKIPGNHLENHLGHITSVTDLPIYLTEFGVLDQPTVSPFKVADYARDFVLAAKRFKEVKEISWYAWGKGMDNGFGIGSNNVVSHPQIRNNLRYTTQIETPTDDYIVYSFSKGRNLRSSPTVLNETNIIDYIEAGEHVEVKENSFFLDNLNPKYFWKEAKYNGQSGYIAFETNMTKKVIAI